MASRTRQSTVQPTPRSSGSGPVRPTQAPSRSTEAPPYEQPTFALNPAAQRTLANLKRAHDLQKLARNIDNAQATLSAAAVDINDRLAAKRVKLQSTKERLQKRRENDELLEGDDELEQSLQEKYEAMQQKVDGMTQRMEETMRRLVDGKEYVNMFGNALEGAYGVARDEASTQASTQNLRTQRTRSGARAEEENDSDDEAEDIPHFQPTDPAATVNGSQNIHAPIDVYKKNLDDARTRYQGRSNYERYAENERYVNYRRLVHDAAYPEDDVPCPPKESWFNDDGTVAPVGYTRRPNNEDDEDSDDDLAVSRATISTRCPLTLREFTDPITSKKCDHSFEASAIMEMIRNAHQRVPQQSGQRTVQAVQCPVHSCNKMLSKDDLQRNDWVIRRIKRQQRAKQQAQEEEDDEDEGANPGGTQRTAQEIDSDGDDDDAIDAEEEEVPIKLKGEPKGTGASRMSVSRRSASRAPPPSSMAIDLLGDDDDEDDEDDEMYD